LDWSGLPGLLPGLIWFGLDQLDLNKLDWLDWIDLDWLGLIELDWLD